MNYRHLLSGAIILSVLMLAGCGSTPMQSVTSNPWVFEIADSYSLIPSSDGAGLTYRAGTGEDMSIIQMSQSRVNSGVSIEQMTSLNLQKLELSLPGYEFVEQSSRRIQCVGDHDGQVVSFITQQGDSKLFHSQYYTLVDGQGYIWSVSSSSDTTRKTLINIVKSTGCEV